MTGSAAGIQPRSELGSITRKSVIMANHTNHCKYPVVRRSKVTPKEILLPVEAKHDTVEPMERYNPMIRRFWGGMSFVCFPAPKFFPSCVRMDSINRRACGN